jgi:hypothetical protein
MLYWKELPSGPASFEADPLSVITFASTITSNGGPGIRTPMGLRPPVFKTGALAVLPTLQSSSPAPCSFSRSRAPAETDDQIRERWAGVPRPSYSLKNTAVPRRLQPGSRSYRAGERQLAPRRPLRRHTVECQDSADVDGGSSSLAQPPPSQRRAGTSPACRRRRAVPEVTAGGKRPLLWRHSAPSTACGLSGRRPQRCPPSEGMIIRVTCSSW